VQIHVGDIKDLNLPVRDVVFTMAVLEHIQDEQVIKKVPPLVGSTLICVEDEVTSSPRHFPRNYKHLFEPMGFEEVYRAPSVSGANERFEARVFKKK